jgi:hypothetical protein
MGMTGGRLDPTDHLRRPWRVHAIAAAEGLALRDVWEVAIPLPAGVPLARWVEALRTEPRGLPSRALFALRRALGRLLGLDRGGTGFVPIYLEPDEVLSRITNRTVTGSRCTSVPTACSVAGTWPSSSPSGGGSSTRLCSRQAHGRLRGLAGEARGSAGRPATAAWRGGGRCRRCGPSAPRVCPSRRCRRRGPPRPGPRA